MTYTERQKAKISKYCYRMNKACGQKDVGKISEYFNHLKHHVMTGGAVTEEEKKAVDTKINEIDSIIKEITGKVSPVVEKNEELEKEIKVKEEKIAQTEKALEEAIENNKNELAKQLREQQESLKAEKQKLLDEIDQVNNQFTSKANDKIDLKTFNTGIDQLPDNLAGIQKYLNSIHAAVEEEIKQLTASGQSVSDELKNLQSTLEQQKTELEAVKDKNTELEEENSTLYKDFDNNLNTLKKSLNDLKDKIIGIKPVVVKSGIDPDVSFERTYADGKPENVENDGLPNLAIQKFSSSVTRPSILSGQSGQPDQPDKSGQSDQPDQSGQPGQRAPGRVGRTESLPKKDLNITKKTSNG